MRFCHIRRSNVSTKLGIDCCSKLFPWDDHKFNLQISASLLKIGQVTGNFIGGRSRQFQLQVHTTLMSKFDWPLLLKGGRQCTPINSAKSAYNYSQWLSH